MSEAPNHDYLRQIDLATENDVLGLLRNLTISKHLEKSLRTESSLAGEASLEIPGTRPVRLTSHRPQLQAPIRQPRGPPISSDRGFHRFINPSYSNLVGADGIRAFPEVLHDQAVTTPDIQISKDLKSCASAGNIYSRNLCPFWPVTYSTSGFPIEPFQTPALSEKVPDLPDIFNCALFVVGARFRDSRRLFRRNH